MSDPTWVSLLAELRAPNLAFTAAFPGDSGHRQPVHTVYGGAHLFRRDTVVRLGELARRSLDQYAGGGAELVDILDLHGLGESAQQVVERVLEKLEREPIEDFRIDFEDGFGHRPDDEEDAQAERAADEVAAAYASDSLPPFIGLRVKTLSEELKGRSVRTLDLFLTRLVAASGGELPPGFVVTLPKVVHVAQVEVFVRVLEALEERLGLPSRALRFELMIETPSAILGPEGRAGVGRFVAAGGQRCLAAHFGTYDYTAGCDITAAHQHMEHPACDFARHVMQVSLAGTGVWLSDGATNVLPVVRHRADRPLTAAEESDNRRAVHNAWRLHFRHVRRSLEHAFYQGWDLHPAQLPTRYAAVFSFFLEGVDSAAARLRNFVEHAAQATLVGDVFDDAATGQGLLNYFLRSISCGALAEDEAVALSGLSLKELRSRSFLTVLEGRRADP